LEKYRIDTAAIQDKMERMWSFGYREFYTDVQQY
jgi:hypothetical protein